MLQFSPRALRFTAVAAALSAVTTLLLGILPSYIPPAPGLEEQLARPGDVIYMTRLWNNFVHIFFALAAYMGAAVVLARRSSALAAFGLLAFVLWGLIEL